VRLEEEERRRNASLEDKGASCVAGLEDEIVRNVQGVQNARDDSTALRKASVDVRTAGLNWFDRLYWLDLSKGWVHHRVTVLVIHSPAQLLEKRS
jgi:hypothetical protein